MRIIDAHAHLFDTPNYLENLVKTLDECNIEKCCISGLGKLFMNVDNNGIKKAINKYPDRLIGAFFVRPGDNERNEIKKAYEDGFRMVKVTLPHKPYNDPSYFPLWETAQELKMPILFHTGIVTIVKKAPQEFVSSWFMHPMRLEPIANAFPDLNMIIAHLGVHWNDDAAELIRMKPNVYADLSGAPTGWRVRLDKIGIKHWLWWKGAFKKIVFGSDVIYNQIAQILTEDIERLEKNQVNERTKKLIFAGNMLKMLGEK
ncbi:MAG: amidohydrolase family protein [Candidatus Hermodarchaeota archaeon]